MFHVGCGQIAREPTLVCSNEASDFAPQIGHVSAARVVLLFDSEKFCEQLAEGNRALRVIAVPEGNDGRLQASSRCDPLVSGAFRRFELLTI